MNEERPRPQRRLAERMSQTRRVHASSLRSALEDGGQEKCYRARFPWASPGEKPSSWTAVRFYQYNDIPLHVLIDTIVTCLAKEPCVVDVRYEVMGEVTSRVCSVELILCSASDHLVNLLFSPGIYVSECMYIGTMCHFLKMPIICEI